MGKIRISQRAAAKMPDRTTDASFAQHVRDFMSVHSHELTPMEARIVRWRFGLDDEEVLTLKEIGDKYNLSRERIRQLQEQALAKIEHVSEDS